jgi:hypothetical protein
MGCPLVWCACENELLYSSIIYLILQKQEIIKYVKYTGCGFYVIGEILKYVKNFKIINKRICYFEMKS